MIHRNRIITGIAALLLLAAGPLLAACAGDDDAGHDQLTRADVEEIVEVAIATLPASAAEAAAAPLRSDPEAYTRFMVASAIEMYESEGLVATLVHYNGEDSIDGQWYVFITDRDDVLRAHAANPSLVGVPIAEVVGPNNFPAGAAVAAVGAEAGAWFSYTYPNPDTGVTEAKHSWMVRHDGLLFGSGWYEPGPPKSDAPAYTQAYVRGAINLYDAVGRDATLAYYNTAESIDGQWYMFIIDESDTIVAHAANEDLRGIPAAESLGPNDYPAGAAVAAAAAEAGAWLDFTYPNPATGGVETKHAWLVRHDGLVFGSGWYEPGPPKSDAPAYTQAFVQQAIDLYNVLGRDAAVAYYSSEASVDDEWYVFIIGAEDGVTIGHPIPRFIGRDPSERIDATGYFYGDEILAADESGRWVDYVLINPATGDDRQKHTWVVLHDGLFFGSGWYEE
ncbi:MAG: hypothetical protein OXG38_09255 [Chloroflexi bacterium]|nr:hypothetical protein [Chloroflexota bacterium]